MTMEKERQSSPILSPPATEFLYPTVEGEKTEGEAIRPESDTTLKGPTKAMTESPPRPTHPDPPRPNLRSRRGETERPKPVGTRASYFGLRRRATGGEAIKKPPPDRDNTDDGASSSSSSSSSDSDEEQQVRRNRAQSQYQGPRMTRLNQIQRHGRHRAGSKGQYRLFALGDDKNKSTGKVRSDGRLAITVDEKVNSGYLAKALGLTLQHHLRPLHRVQEKEKWVPPELGEPATTSEHGIPVLNIVIMVIGSRGDIQPFLKIGKILKEKHGHRVRIATHPAFKDFVEKDIGLEFFSVGGDPSELMAFMVKNPGLIPSMETVRTGEIGRRRESMFEMFQGFWRACVNATDDEKDVANLKMMGHRYVSVLFKHHACRADLMLALHCRCYHCESTFFCSFSLC